MDPAALQVLHHVLEARKRGESDTVSLPGADLRGAQLLRADLVGADLSGAGLDHAQLAGAKFCKANLAAALLRWADLAGADLTEADLRNADLSCARLEGASLAGADLRGATVEGVVGEPATIAGARIDRDMVDRSGIDDDDVMRLWRAGAIIEHIEAFDSIVIRSGSEVSELLSEAGPSDRSVSDMEATLHFERAKLDDAMPPSARVSVEMLRSIAEPAAPLSIRSSALVADSISPAIKMAPAWRPGDRLLGVELVATIGEGNAATVWRAIDSDGEDVAVKLFTTARANVGLSLPSYRRGVAVMNRLTACQAEGVIGLRCVSLNRLGMVMDLAANGSAVDLPALGMGVKGIVLFFARLCRIVDRAHAQGALHRCIKPANILLSADLDPWLTDFDMVDLPTLGSDAHEAGGYAPYAAPEELLGQGTQSPTADIFSLGRVLHFLLLGDHPSAKASDAPELADIATQPAGLVRIVRKCTMRAPEARYQWVEELLGDLDSYEDHDSVGVGGGAEQNFLPYRVSSLGHATPWLSPRTARARKSEAPPARKRPDAKRRGRAIVAPEPNPFGLGRGAEQLVGAVGTVMVLASLLAIELATGTPGEAQLLRMQYLSVAGGGMMSLLLPRAESNARLWRMLWLALGLIGFYLLDLPRWFV